MITPLYEPDMELVQSHPKNFSYLMGITTLNRMLGTRVAGGGGGLETARGLTPLLAHLHLATMIS